MEESEAAMVEVETISGGENVLKIKSLDEWDRSDTLEFISSYHGLPVLWQSEHPFFKDKHAKQTALEILVVKTKERFPAITIMDVKTKINTIRTQFRREMKAIATSQRIYGSKPKLWCFSELSFLMEQEDEQAFSLAGASMDDSNIDLDLITLQVKSEIQEVDIGPNIPVHATLHESDNSEDTYYDNQDF